jgi:hypothetical protein
MLPSLPCWPARQPIQSPPKLPQTSLQDSSTTPPVAQDAAGPPTVAVMMQRTPTAEPELSAVRPAAVPPLPP